MIKKGLLALYLLLSLPVLVTAQVLNQDDISRAAEKFEDERYEEVVELLAPRMDRSGIPAGAYQLLVSAYLQKGNIADAYHYIQQGVNQHVRSLDLRLLKVEVLQRRDSGRALEEMIAVMEEKQQGMLQSNRFTSEDLEDFKAQLSLLRGQELLVQSEYEAAIDYFQSARVLAGHQVEANRGLLYALFQLGDYQQVLQHYEELPGDVQEDHQIISIHSNALLESGETEQLTETYRQRYESNPDDLESGLIYSQLLIESGEIMAANELYNELLENHPEERVIYEHLLELNQRQMNFEGVANVVERMTEAFPEDKELPLKLAGAYENMGDKEEAMAVYDSLKQERGNIYEIAQPRAALLFEQGKKEQAYDDLKASEGQAEAAQKSLDLGKIAYRKNAPGEAVTHFTDYLDANPADSLALILKGRSHLKNNSVDEALQTYKKAIDSGAHWPEAYLHLFRNESLPHTDKSEWFNALSRTLQVLQTHQEQLSVQAQMALQSGTLISEDPFYSAADQLEDMQQSLEELQQLALETLEASQLEALLRDLRQKHGEFAGVYELSGDFYQQMEDYEKALSTYKDGIDVDAENQSVVLSIAEIKQEQGETEEAILWYERALNIEPTSEVYSALIRLYRENGNLDSLIDRWLIRYEARRQDEVFTEHLIEALHRAGRIEEAQEIVQNR